MSVETTGYKLYQLIKHTRWEIEKEKLQIYLMVKMDVDLQLLLDFLDDHGYCPVTRKNLPGVCYHLFFHTEEGDTLYEDVKKAEEEDQPTRYATYCSLV